MSDRISAGELRSMGLDIVDSIPDCATIPRWAMKTTVGEVSGDPEKNLLTVDFQIVFEQPFEWVTVKIDASELQYSDAYAEYIMENSKGDRVICNGDMLTVAMEEGDLFEEFLNSFVKEINET